jgi:hypothetical protein
MRLRENRPGLGIKRSFALCKRAAEPRPGLLARALLARTLRALFFFTSRPSTYTALRVEVQGVLPIGRGTRSLGPEPSDNSLIALDQFKGSVHHQRVERTKHPVACSDQYRCDNQNHPREEKRLLSGVLHTALPRHLDASDRLV